MKKKVLHLSVKKQWFDMISAGEKTEEYREIKPYWIKRLTTNCEVAYDVAAETYCGKVLYRPYTHVSSSLMATARIVHELRRRLRVSPSAILKKVYAPTSGLVLSFLSLNSSSV